MQPNLETVSNPDLRDLLATFVPSLSDRCGDNLKSVLLYGGAAKNDYTFGKSNSNILMVFEKMDLEVLDSLCVLFQKAIADFKLSPFILTSSEIAPASDVFAVKLFDIKQHHVLLYGKQVLNDTTFESKNLQFIAEQDLRNQLARMKFFYIKNFNLPEQLLIQIKKSYTTLLINANMLLYLRHGKYYETRDEITNHLLKESDMEASTLAELQKTRAESLELNIEKIKYLFDKLMLQYKLLIDVLKKQNANA
jgi:hypothetical protein